MCLSVFSKSSQPKVMSNSLVKEIINCIKYSIKQPTYACEFYSKNISSVQLVWPVLLFMTHSYTRYYKYIGNYLQNGLQCIVRKYQLLECDLFVFKCWQDSSTVGYYIDMYIYSW